MGAGDTVADSVPEKDGRAIEVLLGRGIGIVGRLMWGLLMGDTAGLASIGAPVTGGAAKGVDTAGFVTLVGGAGVEDAGF